MFWTKIKEASDIIQCLEKVLKAMSPPTSKIGKNIISDPWSCLNKMFSMVILQAPQIIVSPDYLKTSNASFLATESLTNVKVIQQQGGDFSWSWSIYCDHHTSQHLVPRQLLKITTKKIPMLTISVMIQRIIRTPIPTAGQKTRTEYITSTKPQFHPLCYVMTRIGAPVLIHM